MVHATDLRLCYTEESNFRISTIRLAGASIASYSCLARKLILAKSGFERSGVMWFILTSVGYGLDRTVPPRYRQKQSSQSLMSRGELKTASK